jgi:hypothetical protein
MANGKVVSVPKNHILKMYEGGDIASRILNFGNGQKCQLYASAALPPEIVSATHSIRGCWAPKLV